MKKCIVISDSFKGSLPSRDICAIARERIPLYFPACEVRALSVADGGEGTVDCFLDSCGGERVLVSGVQNPYGEPIDAAYALLPDGTAVIEMAAAAGLPLVAGRKNPCVTTTYGVGQLIADALARGARRIVLGLGGSATNDGGCGCAAALQLQALMGKRRPPRLPHHCSPQADWIRLLSSAENSIAQARMLAWERANFWWPKPMNLMRRF